MRQRKTEPLSRLSLLLMLLIITLKLSCSLEPKSKSGPEHPVALPAPYSGNLSAENAVTFSSSGVIVSKTVRALASKGAKDPSRELFLTGGLYKLLTLRCTPCHGGINDYPFASSGADLAWISVKKYLVDPADGSKIISQIRGGHSGAQASWEAEFTPLIETVAKSIKTTP